MVLPAILFSSLDRSVETSASKIIPVFVESSLPIQEESLNQIAALHKIADL
jgi:hypothetical protein